MKLSLLKNLLRCPFCGGALHGTGADIISDKMEHGILTCYCSRYPVVAGIPILKRDKKTLKAIPLIEGGRYVDAILALIEPDSLPIPPIWRLSACLPLGSRLRDLAQKNMLQEWREQARALLTDSQNHVTVCELLDFYFQKNKGDYNYFAFRLGQPRHLVALSLARLIPPPQKPILDICCGFGPMIPNLMDQASGQQVIGVEASLFALYVAKHWVAPEAEYICCSAENALPFADKAFSATFCSDAFQYIVNKQSFVQELYRIVDEGVIILTALPNKLLLSHDGIPLSPEGCHALFRDRPHRIVADKDILDRYLLKKGPDLSTQPETSYLNQERLLSVVGATHEDIFCNSSAFVEWPHAKGQLGINPFFEMDGVGGGGEKIRLRRRTLSRGYDEDNPEYKIYVPEKVELDPSVLRDIAGGKRTPTIEKLIEQCVVLSVPDNFYRDPQSGSAGAIRKLPPN